MIAQIDGETARRLLKGRSDPFSLKINGNLLSYEGYDFCSVYRGEGTLIGRYYGDLVIRTEGELSQEAFEELALFLKTSGFGSAICGEKTGRRLSEYGFKCDPPDFLYEFSADKVKERKSVPVFSELRENPPYDEVFNILKDGFPNIDHDGWYTDMNHRVRHGTARVYIYGGATATVNSENETAALVTLLSVKKELRGHGDAKKLLRSLGFHFDGIEKKMYVLCRAELMPFYERVGFNRVGSTVTFYNMHR